MSLSIFSRAPQIVALLTLFSLGVVAESVEGQGTITGSVEDSGSGLALGSVQISIANLDIGVLSQANGTYQLTGVPAGTHTLTGQRLGYETVTVQVTVGNQTVVADLILSQAALALDELIVPGTAGGTQRRAIGNVVERMDAAAITNMAPVVSVEQLLSTRVPGLAMMSSGGFVGAGDANIRIRGSSSVGLPNDPLVYIDGVRVNTDRNEGRRQTTGRLNDINPEDIASIEVIKGPAASTLYGTEASNGVIQIITKRGETGDVTFDASVGLGVNYMQDPHGKIWTNWATHPDTGELLSMHMLDVYKSRNAGEDLFRYGALQEYSLSARGGTDLFRYFAAFNRNDQDGIVSWNWDQRSTGRVNLDITPNDQLTIGLSGSMMSGDTRFVGDLWRQTMSGSPLSAVEYGGYESKLKGWGGRTPEGLRDGQQWLVGTERKNMSARIQYAPTDWLTNRLTFGSDLTDETETNTIFRESNAPQGIWGGTGRGRRTISDMQTQLATLDYAGTAVYNPTSWLGTNTSVGFQYYKKETWFNYARGDEFATEFLSTVGAAALTQANEDRLENVTVGFYVQEQLNLREDRLFLTGAVRVDENSAFGADYGAQTYPKLSGTWVLSEEPFWGFDILQPLRLRGAWGAAGRQPDVFAAQRLYKPETGPGNSPVLTPSSYGNADLGPERAEEVELGFDAGFWDERIQLGYTYYWKSTMDAILDKPVLPSLAFPGKQFVNAGQIDNWGSEVSLDVALLQAQDLRWDMTLAFATMDNKIVSLGDIDRITIRRSRENVVGYPMAGLHDFKVVSADFVGSTSNVENIMCDAGTGADGRSMGGAAVACGDANRVYWGNTHHTWTINALSTWTLFNDLRIFASVEGRGGGYVHADQIGARHSSWKNSYARNHAIEAGAIFNAQMKTSRNPTGYIPNGYLNFEELGMQYQLPESMAARVGASRASIGLSVRNLKFLWREQWTTIVGGERIPDVRQSLGNQEFGGQQDTQAPLSSTALLRMRVTF